MEAMPQLDPPPKKACMITLLFEVKTDEEALAVKKVLDEQVGDIDKKRYTFQIVET